MPVVISVSVPISNPIEIIQPESPIRFLQVLSKLNHLIIIIIIILIIFTSSSSGGGDGDGDDDDGVHESHRSQTDPE